MIDFDYVLWNEEGNARHIEAADLTPEEVEEVLSSPFADPDQSDSSGRPAVFGYTSTGKYIIVVYEIDDEGGVIVIEPITAYEVPEPY